MTDIPAWMGEVEAEHYKDLADTIIVSVMLSHHSDPEYWRHCARFEAHEGMFHRANEAYEIADEIECGFLGGETI